MRLRCTRIECREYVGSQRLVRPLVHNIGLSLLIVRTILAALHTLQLALPATALRGDVLSERAPTAGLILRDGEPGAPEVTFSLLS